MRVSIENMIWLIRIPFLLLFFFLIKKKKFYLIKWYLKTKILLYLNVFFIAIFRHVRTAQRASVCETETEPLLTPTSVDFRYGSTQTLEDITEEREVKLWKKNVLRIILLLTQVGLAILLRNAFAYISALTGAVGSSLLSYILPCTIHLKARWPQLRKVIIVKDFIIIIFSIIASALTIVLLIYQMVEHRL